MLKQSEEKNRNKLKEEKPYVYEKMIKLSEKFKRGDRKSVV